MTIYIPSRVGNHDNAWASYSELAPIQYHGYSLNVELYLLLVTYPFIFKWFVTYSWVNLTVLFTSAKRTVLNSYK